MTDYGEVTGGKMRRFVGEAVYGVVAVLARGDQLLLIRRARGVAAGGRWCLPGGGVEPGESSSQAIVREMAEELGITVRPVEQVWRWTREDGKLLLDWWRVEAGSDRLRPNPAEVAEARWLTPAEIRKLPDVLPGLLEFLDRFYPAGGPV
jgi:8-oxo-dGTP diphosphatase